MQITWLVMALELIALGIGLTVASVWSLFHLRRLRPFVALAFRDSLLGSMVVFLLLRGWMEFLRTEDSGLAQPLVAPIFVPVASALLSVFAFPALLWLSLTLIALAGLVSRECEAVERSMLPVFWPLLTVGLVLDIVLSRTNLWPPGALALASPWLALGVIALIRRRHDDIQVLTTRLAQQLQRRCVRRKGRLLRDLRGLVLGALAGLLCLSLLTPTLQIFLAPYQGWAYSSATQTGNRLMAMRSFLASNGQSDSRVVTSLFDQNRKSLAAFQRVVVLTYDDPLRRAAQERSEARLQTELLGKLASFHPTAIVLPLPPLDDDHQPVEDGLLPSVSEASIAKNTNDLPALAAAMKRAGTVWLSHSPRQNQSEATRAVEKAARGIGSSAVSGQGTLDIPALSPLSEPRPLALQLAPKQTKISTEPVLVDYRLDLHQLHAPIPISHVLQGQKLYDPVGKSWLSPEAFFKDKYVFVEALTPHLHPTPVGMRSEEDIQAQALGSMLQSSPFSTLPVGIRAGLVLALAVLVGHLCVGRAPLEGLWRVLLPVSLVGGGCFVLTAFGSLQADPVLPVLGGLLSFFMVTQFTFAMERDERERNRSLLGRFVAPQAIEELLDDPEGKLGLGGKRRQIVVIFADVRGFSSFAEKRTPEAVVTTMNRYLQVLTDALNDHAGILDKYTGDGLMALFLVEEKTPQEDVARAVRGAVAMARAVKATAATMDAEGGDALAVGMGLHYGEAVVGLVGHPTRQINYTALGHTVVVAARLQTLASGGELILSEAVWRALPPDTVHAEAGETVTVKGVADPVPIYRLRV